MGGDGQGGIFTWREKHGRKVSGTGGRTPLTVACHISSMLSLSTAGVLGVSQCRYIPLSDITLTLCLARFIPFRQMRY